MLFLLRGVGNPREELLPLANKLLTLYERCEMFSDLALPQAGGVLDQDEILIQLLSLARQAVLQYQEEILEEERFRMHHQERVQENRIGSFSRLRR